MGGNIENESKIVEGQESLLAVKNRLILSDCGITSLLEGLRDVVSDLDLNRKNSIISSVRPTEDWESITLVYMWGDLNYLNEKNPKSLILVSSVVGENKIHLMFREVKQNGEEKIESSVFDVSDQDKKKEMLEKIKVRFSNSLISNKRKN